MFAREYPKYSHTYNFIFLKRTVFGDSVLARASQVPKCLAWEAVSSKLTQTESMREAARAASLIPDA